MLNYQEGKLPRNLTGLDRQKAKHFTLLRKTFSTDNSYKSACSSWLTSRASQLITVERYSDANKDCLEAMVLTPKELAPYTKLSAACYESGKFEESIKVLRLAPHSSHDALGEEIDNRPSILFYMGLSNIKLGDEEKGVGQMRLALKMGDDENDNFPEEREVMKEVVQLYDE